jgi:hypothetical protein
MAWAGHCNELVLATLTSAWGELSAAMAGASWQELPGRSFQYFYKHEDPLVVCYGVMLTVALLTWLWSTVWRTAAAVDRLWSVTPGVYVAILARGAVARWLAGGATPSDERQLVMLALVVAWCCRWAERGARAAAAAAAPAMPQPETPRPTPHPPPPAG